VQLLGDGDEIAQLSELHESSYVRQACGFTLPRG
jgi:hypothetical protein